MSTPPTAAYRRATSPRPAIPKYVSVGFANAKAGRAAMKMRLHIVTELPTRDNLHWEA